MEKLSPQIIKYLHSNEFAEMINTVGQKHGLHLDQIEFLISTTLDYIFGNLEKENFKDELSYNLDTEKEITEKIVFDINKDVLEPLRMKILESYNTPEPGVIISSKEDIPAQTEPQIELPVEPQTERQLEKQTEMLIEPSPEVKEVPKASNLPELREEQGLSVVNSNINKNSATTENTEIKKVENNTQYTVDPYREPTK